MTRGSYVVSASLKGRRSAGAVLKVAAGERPLSRLFRCLWGRSTSCCRRSCRPASPAGSRSSNGTIRARSPGRALHEDEAGNGLKVADETGECLRSHGIEASGTQDPKSRKALEFFAPGARDPAPSADADDGVPALGHEGDAQSSRAA